MDFVHPQYDMVFLIQARVTPIGTWTLSFAQRSPRRRFLLHVESFDGKVGVVNMKAEGPQEPGVFRAHCSVAQSRLV